MKSGDSRERFGALFGQADTNGDIEGAEDKMAILGATCVVSFALSFKVATWVTNSPA